MPKLPKLNDIPEIFVNKAGKIAKGIDGVSKLIDTVSTGIDKIGDAFGEPETPPVSTITPAEIQPSQAAGTACLPCCRDHLSTSSSALSEAIRFARDNGVKGPESLRRIRIALDELNAMERIDLAPDETAKLKGAEKDLANWTLKSSRGLRHSITAIKDVDSMEQAAAEASAVTEEFMSRLWTIPEDECETCGEMRESIRQFIEKRKRERGEA